MKIKYWNASGSGFTTSLIPALQNIGILHHKKTKLRKNMRQSVYIEYIIYILWREETFLNAFRKEKLACSTGFWDICFLLNGYLMGYTLAIGVFWVMTLWSQKHWSLRFIRFSAWKLGLSIYLLEFFFALSEGLNARDLKWNLRGCSFFVYS